MLSCTQLKICDGLPRNRLRCLCENLVSSLSRLSVIEYCVVVQLKTPLVSEDVTVLTPGSMAPSVPSADSGRPKKRRRRLSVDVSSTVRGMENCCQIIEHTQVGRCHRVTAPCGAGAPLFPLVHLSPFLLFPFFHWLYLFSSFVHPFPFYQNSPTPFPGLRSEEATEPGLVCVFLCVLLVLSVFLS